MMAIACSSVSARPLRAASSAPSMAGRTGRSAVLLKPRAGMGPGSFLGCRASLEGASRSGLPTRAGGIPSLSRAAVTCKLSSGSSKGSRAAPALSDAIPEPETEKAPSLFEKIIKGVAKPAAVAALIAALALSSPGDALAARSSGRMGGGSFRSSASRSMGSRSMGMSRSAPRVAGGAGVSRMGGATFMPSFFFAPMGYGYYGGGGGGGGILTLLLLGFMAYTAYQSMNGGGGMLQGGYEEEYEDEKIGVAKLQVGLLGLARDLQDDLERIADSADTSTPRGLHYVLTETVLALMRNPDMCVYACNEGKNVYSMGEAESAFNFYSMEERGKFAAETRTNVGGMKNTSIGGVAAAEGRNEFIVVTLVVAAAGGLKMPRVTDSTSMKQALTKLGSVPAEDLTAVEVLWTPEDRNDTLTLDEVLRDYPSMQNI